MRATLARLFRKEGCFYSMDNLQVDWTWCDVVIVQNWVADYLSRSESVLFL